MNELNSGRGKAWSNMYSSSSNPSSQIDKEGPWKSFGSSMNAISFGFVATAILISMFLIMAIFEHLFRPNPSSTQMLKLRTPPQHLVQASYASDFSVVMPGHNYPSFIAQPAPLPLPLPLPREEMHCPSLTLSLSLISPTNKNPP